MGTFASTEEARAFFAGDRYAHLTGVTLDELTDEYAAASLALRDDHKNAYGGVMGGAIYTLADFAFAVASNFDKEQASVSIVSQANFLSATRGSVLYAEASLLKEGRNNCFYEVKVTDDLGKLIATLTFTGAHVPKKPAK